MTQKPTIEMSVLDTLDIRICRIEKVEPILRNPKKEPAEDNPVKAYKLTIDTGFDHRECLTNLVSIPAGDLEGIRVPFILNLPEAEIRGVVSRAMIVCPHGTVSADGLLSYVHGSADGPPVGTVVF